MESSGRACLHDDLHALERSSAPSMHHKLRTGAYVALSLNLNVKAKTQLITAICEEGPLWQKLTVTKDKEACRCAPCRP